jgi:cell division topological specificity factor
MLEWLNRLFGVQTSSSVAKDRLRLVLLSDHLALAPDVIEALRRDLFDVISRYVEVDEANSDVSFEHKDQGIAMLANIPIISLKDRPSPPSPRLPDEETLLPRRKRRRRKTSGVPQTAPAQ